MNNQNPDYPPLDSSRNNNINERLVEATDLYGIPEPSSMQNAKGQITLPPVLGQPPLVPPQPLIDGFSNNIPPPPGLPPTYPRPYTGQQYYPPQPPMNYPPYQNQPYQQPHFVPVATTTIVIDAIPNTVNCPVCLRPTANRINRVAGGTAFCWFIVLLICFWPLCWLPFVMGSCQDTQLVCVSCGTTKVTIEAR